MSVPRTQSLTRALALLHAIERYGHGASTAELARATELAPATAGRLLATLEDAGFAARDRGGWRIGPEVVRLGKRADPHRALARQAQPVLDNLAAGAGESAMLAIPRPGPAVEVIAQADGPRLLGLTNWVGRPIALHASAAGKLVLGELDDRALTAWIARERPARLTAHTLVGRTRLVDEIKRVRAQGWADLDEESEPGLASIGVGVRDADRTLVAVVGFSGPRDRLDRQALLAPLQRAAGALRRGLRPAEIETCSNGVRKATFRDDDGNEIGFGGAPAPTEP
jgi:DNA-binding IclR family transcriptional regulator